MTMMRQTLLPTVPIYCLVYPKPIGTALVGCPSVVTFRTCDCTVMYPYRKLLFSHQLYAIPRIDWLARASCCSAAKVCKSCRKLLIAASQYQSSEWLEGKTTILLSEGKSEGVGRRGQCSTV
jgi:hypothetical protein